MEQSEYWYRGGNRENSLVLKIDQQELFSLYDSEKTDLKTSGSWGLVGLKNKKCLIDMSLKSYKER